jgi:DNA polymerase-3 subunit delta'
VTLPAEGKARSRDDVFTVLDAWTGWWRDLMLTAAGSGQLVADRERLAVLTEHAARLDVAQAAAGVRALQRCRADLRMNVNARLALEAMMLRLPRGRGAARRRGA